MTEEAQDDDTAITVRARLRDFLAAASAGRPTKVPLADGLRTHALAAAREDRVIVASRAASASVTAAFAARTAITSYERCGAGR